MGLEQIQKQGRDKTTRRLLCYRLTVVKNDLKSTLLLMPEYGIGVRALNETVFLST